MKLLVWILLVFLCLAIGLYPLLYLTAEGRIGLLQTKSEGLLENNLWRVGFYSHIIGGGVALFVGWSQFVKSWRVKYVSLHRWLGKIYLFSVLVGGVAAIGIAPFSSTGWIASLGFGSLGICWLYFTWQAYWSIRRRDVSRHERMMIYSYSACCAAITLRFWLPLLLAGLNLEFSVAYPIVAWLCWIPNLAVAQLIVRMAQR